MDSARCYFPLLSSSFCSLVHKHSPSAIHYAEGKGASGIKWYFLTAWHKTKVVVWQGLEKEGVFTTTGAQCRLTCLCRSA